RGLLRREELRVPDQEEAASAQGGAGSCNLPERLDLGEEDPDRLAWIAGTERILAQCGELRGTHFLQRLRELVGRNRAFGAGDGKEPLDVRLLEPEREAPRLTGAARIRIARLEADQALRQP